MTDDCAYHKPPLHECSSYKSGAHICHDGFPQVSAVCWGGLGSTPFCMNETACARLYGEHGRPPDRLVSRRLRP